MGRPCACTPCQATESVHASCLGTLSSPLSLQPGGLQGHDEKQIIRVVPRPPGAALGPDAGQVAEWLFPV